MSSPRPPARPAPPTALLAHRRVHSGHGHLWWQRAWALFLRAPLVWGLMGLILMAAGLIISTVPLVGAVALALGGPVVIGGWLLSLQRLEQGEPPGIQGLFICFEAPWVRPLLSLGLFNLAVMLGLELALHVLGAGAALSMLVGLLAGGSGSVAGLMAGLGGALLALALMLLAATVLSMALWFAPALVALQGVPPRQALQASVAAALANTPAMLVYGLLGALAMLLATLALGLGWLLLLPLTLISMYTSWQDVYGG